MPYLDYAASAPLRPVAREALLSAASEVGNAASSHGRGRRAGQLVELARAQVAAWVGRPPHEVVWTSGGTESDNLALLGVAAKARGRHLIVSAIEHRAVLAPAQALAAAGWRLDLAPVDPDGVLDLDALSGLLRPETALVSVMAVNNEMGGIQPLGEIFARVRAKGALVHVDAAQAHYLDLQAVDADLMSLSSHKIGGPMGVGALIVRTKTPVGPLFHGGAHERGLRPGSLNVPGIAAFGAAAAALSAARSEEAARVTALGARLAEHVLASVAGSQLLGRTDARAPQILALTFAGVEGEALLTQLDLAGVEASTGAACTTLGLAPSHVLPALGLDAAQVAGSLRLSLGWATTAQEIDQAAAVVSRVASQLMGMKPMAGA